MYCRKCGAQIDNGSAFCPNCGASQNDGQAPRPSGSSNNYDSGSIGWGILGFFLPLVGLILWAVWREDRPMSAKMAGLGALVGFIFTVVINIVTFALILSLGGITTTTP